MFTTKKVLKKDIPELYPGKTVLIQHSYNVEDKHTVTKFTLNKDAMLAFGLTPFTANTNNITWGWDDETDDILLAALDGTDKTSKITAKNEFSNQKFLDQLVRTFKINPLQENVFELDIYDEQGIKVSRISLLQEKETVIEEAYPGSEKNIDEMLSTTPKAVDEDTSSFDEEINKLHKEQQILF